MTQLAFANILPQPKPLRDWQQRAHDMAHDLLIVQNEPYMYVSAPPGSGKSRLIYEMGSLDISGLRILIVGYRTIMKQHKDAFEKEFGCVLINEDDEWELYQTPRGDHYIISTWQGLTARAAKNDVPGEVGFLFFDECHIGGSDSNNLSIPVVLEHFSPTKRVFVSATLHNVSEKLLAPKDARHTFSYAWEQAYEDGGIINDIDLVEVHTGLTAQIERIERIAGQTMSDLEVLEGDELSDLAAKLKDKSVDIRAAIPQIIQYNHRAMIELYMSRHPGQQAIFFTPTTEMADWAAAQFNSKARRLGVWNTTIAHACHTKLDQVDETIERFRNGEITVLFVVNMLQEGFDLKSLHLAFDCRFYRDWSVSRIARLIQKIGRVSRYVEGKAVSQYYYSRDLKDFYNQGVPETPNLTLAWNRGEHHESVIVEKDHPDFQIAQDAAVAAAQIRYVEGNETAGTIDVFGVSPDNIRTEDFEIVGRVKTVSVPLYILRRSRDWKAVKSFSARGLFGNSADANKATLLAMAAAGEPRPFAITKIGSALSDYTGKRSKSYDPEFDIKIRETIPAWFVNTADTNKATLLAMAAAGEPRPLQKTPLGSSLTCYISKRSNCYDSDFDLMIRKTGEAWFIDGRAVKKTTLLAMAAAGEPRPLQKTSLGSALSHYTGKRSKSYDPEFDIKIREMIPAWFVNTADMNKATLLAMAAAGEPRPAQMSTMLGRALPNYTCKTSPAYDPEFDIKIREMIPAWFVNTADTNKATLLAMAAAGEPRPSAITKIGSALSTYTCKTSRAYDPNFNIKIREMIPAWFVNTADTNKATLLAMAAAGEPRPSKIALGKLLSSYISKQSQSYDPEFDIKIREMIPAWFVNTVDTNKEILLGMAADGQPRPSVNTTLSRVLLNYTRKKSKSYDPEFDATIRKHQPQWFRKPKK